MKSERLFDRKPAMSRSELFTHAREFIRDSLNMPASPSWLRDDESYDWRSARNAHVSKIPLSQLGLLCDEASDLLSKIHYAIWLEHEDERLGRAIKELEEKRAEVRCNISSFDVYA